MAEEVPTLHQFHHYVVMIVIFQKLEDTHDVRMNVLLTELKLIHQQLPLIVRHELVFGHNFDGARDLRLNVHACVYAAKRASSKLVEDFVMLPEVLDVLLLELSLERQKVVLGHHTFGF